MIYENITAIIYFSKVPLGFWYKSKAF